MVHRITKYFFKEQKHRDFISLLALCTSVTALTFQITVLHPWHLELSKEFKELEKKVNNK